VENAKEHHPRYQLTEHAHRTMAARGISTSWVGRVLSEPLRIEKDEEDPTLQHGLGRIPERGDRMLRVVYNATVKPWLVVTAFFDRKASREL
jgi:hypothetical protein